mgnify:FL=1
MDTKQQEYKMKNKDNNYDEYTYNQKLSLINHYKEHPEFERFHQANIIYYPLCDREEPDRIDAIFEVLMWRLGIANKD